MAVMDKAHMPRTSSMSGFPKSRHVIAPHLPTLRAMYGRCPRCKRNLTFLRSVRVQPCIRPIVARRITPVAMRPQWPLALM
jgi:hypothetical protein